MQSKASSVKEYLAGLSAERRTALEALRTVIRANLDPLFEEGMQYGMIGYYVPHSVYPAGYHCDPKQPLPFAGLASQKNHIGVYLMSLCMDDDEGGWFRTAWEKTGRKLDMGKSCIRFRSLKDVPLDLIGEAVRRTSARGFIKFYEAARSRTAAPGPKPASPPKPARKTPGKGK